jgi:hypothetical protein
MKKWLIALIVLVVIGLAIFFVAGYFLGNVPIASKLLGTNKSRDLGVTLSTEAAYSALSALDKPVTADELIALRNNPSSYTSVRATLTESEASSLLAIGQIPDFPFRLTQLKFGDNGAVQASGVIDTAALQKALQDANASGEIVDKVMGIVKTAKYVNFYIDGTCSIVNNRVDATISKAEIGKIGLPVDIVQNNSASIANGVANELRSRGYNIRSMTITNGKVALDMDRPISSINPWLDMVQY